MNMKKILFITAILLGSFGYSQISTDSVVKYTSRKGRVFKINGPGSSVGSDGLGTARDVGPFTVVDENTATLDAGINANLIADGSVTNAQFQYLSDVLLPIQQQLDSKLNINGSASMAGNLAMGGFKIVNMADGTNPQDAVTLSQLTAATGSNITVHPDSDESSLRLGIADNAASLAGFTTLSTDIIICKICPSIIEGSSTTIDFSETGRHAFFDGDGNGDPASYDLQNMQNGYLFEVYVNQTTEPTFSPVPTQTTDSLDWTDDSLANTNLTGYIYKNGKGNVLLTWVKDF